MLAHLPGFTVVTLTSRWIPGTLAALGILLWIVGVCFPVYSEPGIAQRLSHELQSLPSSSQSREWYRQMKNYETPHKRLTDLGRGMMALGAGVLVAHYVGAFYLRHQGWKRIGYFSVVWLGLWAIKIPFSSWYYKVRLWRWDFPIWDDVTTINVMSESMVWIAGALVSLPIVFAFLFRHEFASNLRPRRPSGWLRWARALALWLWLALLIVIVGASVWDGDEGMIISCVGAMPLLLAMLSANPKTANSPTTPAADASPLLPPTDQTSESPIYRFTELPKY